MRQSKWEIRDRGRVARLLEKAAVGRLGTVNAYGYPMIKPLNFVFARDKVYFHGAYEGEKIEDIQRDSRVCFEVDIDLGYVKAENHACEAGFLYQSVVITGHASIVEERKEKLFALEELMKKYQPEGNYKEFPEDTLARTAVVRIDVNNMTGKERTKQRAG